MCSSLLATSPHSFQQFGQPVGPRSKYATKTGCPLWGISRSLGSLLDNFSLGHLVMGKFSQAWLNGCKTNSAVDSIGRRWGLIQDVIIMFLGLCMLVASWGTTLQGWVICYAWSLFFYGIGVGGEVSSFRDIFLLWISLAYSPASMSQVSNLLPRY